MVSSFVSGMARSRKRAHPEARASRSRWTSLCDPILRESLNCGTRQQRLEEIRGTQRRPRVSTPRRRSREAGPPEGGPDLGAPPPGAAPSAANLISERAGGWRTGEEFRATGRQQAPALSLGGARLTPDLPLRPR